MPVATQVLLLLFAYPLVKTFPMTSLRQDLCWQFQHCLVISNGCVAQEWPANGGHVMGLRSDARARASAAYEHRHQIATDPLLNVSRRAPLVALRHQDKGCFSQGLSLAEHSVTPRKTNTYSKMYDPVRTTPKKGALSCKTPFRNSTFSRFMRLMHLRVFPLWGTQRNLIVSVSSQSFQGKVE